jgi:Mg2+-importing ATPase
LATQTLVIFVIRTRRVPFFHSRPSRPMLVATVSCALLGAVLPFSPVAHVLGFTHLPLSFELILVLMVATYLALAEAGKARFFAPERGPSPIAPRRHSTVRRVHRLASRWSHANARLVSARSRP